jgi:hypothetical protein
MADLLLATQAAPSAPSAGSGIIYLDSTSKRPAVMDDAGAALIYPGYRGNNSVTSQGAGFASDTYLVGSNILIPAGYPRAGSRYRCSFDVSKSAAGTATPIIIVRFGIAGAIGDTARLTFTFGAATGAVDVGRFEIEALFRSVGGSGVLQGRAVCVHTTASGLINTPGQVLQVTSGAFDTAVANSYIGLSVNGGTSAAWTIQQVLADLDCM